jgi:catechol 2,3-dioxygenase-like lactoylglutathione lyase family enzyme
LASSLSALKQLDYTVIFTRDMTAMRRFYEDVLGLSLRRKLGPAWIEYDLGVNTLALSGKGGRFDDPAPPPGALSLQIAFRVEVHEVDGWADMLAAKGIAIVDPPTDQPWGHRTLFFRDPDGNVVEIYADI